jgi:hypothetical protein
MAASDRVVELCQPITAMTIEIYKDGEEIRKMINAAALRKLAFNKALIDNAKYTEIKPEQSNFENVRYAMNAWYNAHVHRLISIA